MKFNNCYIRNKVGCHCTDSCGYEEVIKDMSKEESKPETPDKQHFDKMLLKELVWKLDREVWAHVPNPDPSEQWSTSKAREESYKLIAEYIGNYDQLRKENEHNFKRALEIVGERDISIKATINNETMKGKIIKIGTINADGKMEGWHFDGLGVCTGLQIDYKNGNHLFCGYTEDELRKIIIDSQSALQQTPPEPTK